MAEGLGRKCIFCDSRPGFWSASDLIAGKQEESSAYPPLYVSTLSVNHLVVQVLFNNGEEDLVLMHGRDVAPSMQRIWPIERDSITAAAGPSLTNRGLQRVASVGRRKDLGSRRSAPRAGPEHLPDPFGSGQYVCAVRPLRYSINVTLDGCCDHRAISPDEEMHRHATENLAQADALLLGRVTYEMMESAWRPPGQMDAMPDWTAPFGRTIDAVKKYVVSSTLDRVDWNAELLRGDVGEAVRKLKQEPGEGLAVGGVKLPRTLAELGLIDEYEFVVQPRLVGHGPTLFAGLSKRVDLRLVGRLDFDSGAVAMRYEPRAS